MALTYQAIATVTVGAGGTSSIAFSSIPATYTDLLISTSLRTAASDGSNPWRNVTLTINSSSSNFTRLFLIGTGSSTITSTGTDNYLLWVNSNLATSSSFGSAQVYITNYLSNSKKSISVEAITENNATAANASFTAALWDNTSAITSLALESPGTTFVQHSTATLYGIKKD